MIVVHDGRAHADDFLAACVCAYRTGFDIFRLRCDESMLDDPLVWVLDQGMRFEPELHNFDHHQLAEERCSLTMVLDHFYGPSYRESLPELRFLEILDSFGSARAAEFAGMKQDRVGHVSCAIGSSMLGIFSGVGGRVEEPLRSVMRLIGEDLCKRIEERDSLMKSMEGALLLDVDGVLVLDVTKCVPPEGRGHDSLPTKRWCKDRDVCPRVILTMDARDRGFFRMVSVNGDDLRFENNPLSSFTHASGFLTVFAKYEDHAEILSKYTRKA